MTTAVRDLEMVGNTTTAKRWTLTDPTTMPIIQTCSPRPDHPSLTKVREPIAAENDTIRMTETRTSNL